MFAQHGLDLAELDAMATDLDLIVEATQVFERAVRSNAARVAGAVHAVAGRERVGRKRASVSSGRLK